MRGTGPASTMLLPDVNVLVNGFRRESPQHDEHVAWLDRLVNGPADFAMSELVLSGFLRVVTHPQIFRTPTPIGTALEFVRAVVDAPTCVRVRPGPRHLGLFEQLCLDVGATGNTIPDAYHAALAVESGSTWVTNDRGFARFARLRWQTPFDD